MGKRQAFGKLLAVVLCAAMALGVAGCGSTEDINGKGVDDVLQSTCSYAVRTAGIQDVEDETSTWLVIGCRKANSNELTDEDYSDYLDGVRGWTKAQKGLLSDTRITTNARVAMGVATVGADPTKVEGYDLMAPVDDYDKVYNQGINAEIYALIASKYTGRKLVCKKRYLDDILAAQREDGGIGFEGSDEGDVDITAMAIQALSFYKDKKKVAKAIQSAREFLSKKQGSDGSYGNCESTAQVIMALGCLGEDPTAAKDFIKEGKTLGDGLMLYRRDKAFCHESGGGIDMMATEQAILALDAIVLGRQGISLFAK